MSIKIRLAAIALAICPPFLTAGAQEPNELIAELSVGTIDLVRINLNAWGSTLGFEEVVAGNDPRIAALIELIRNAEPGTGHKCANVGAVRFLIAKGRQIALGILPSHDETGFELRLYSGEQYVGVVRVDRDHILSVLEDMGVPTDNPWLRP